jgi:hypothetical protein
MLPQHAPRYVVAAGEDMAPASADTVRASAKLLHCAKRRHDAVYFFGIGAAARWVIAAADGHRADQSDDDRRLSPCDERERSSGDIRQGKGPCCGLLRRAFSWPGSIEYLQPR